jgi:hypothetical protein
MMGSSSVSPPDRIENSTQGPLELSFPAGCCKVRCSAPTRKAGLTVRPSGSETWRGAAMGPGPKARASSPRSLGKSRSGSRRRAAAAAQQAHDDQGYGHARQDEGKALGLGNRLHLGCDCERVRGIGGRVRE